MRLQRCPGAGRTRAALPSRECGHLPGPTKPLPHAAAVLDIAFQATHLSGTLSAPVAGREKEKADDLGEDGGTAGLQTLGVVGDCGLSHWTIDDRVWLGLKVEV